MRRQAEDEFVLLRDTVNESIALCQRAAVPGAVLPAVPPSLVAPLLRLIGLCHKVRLPTPSPTPTPPSGLWERRFRMPWAAFCHIAQGVHPSPPLPIQSNGYYGRQHNEPQRTVRYSPRI